MKRASGSAGVDPRRVLDGALVVLLLGAVVFAARWTLDPENLPLNMVEVRGDFRHLDPAAVQASVPVGSDAAFFGVSLGAIRDDVAELAWIREVEVSRVWPDTLRLTIAERRPVARVNDVALLDSRGNLFRPATLDGFDSLPAIHGPEMHAADLGRLRVGLEREFARVGERVQEIEGDARGALRLTLDSGIEVVVGRHERRKRVSRLIQSWEGLQRGGEGRVVRVDLRYPNGFAVRYASPEDEAA